MIRKTALSCLLFSSLILTSAAQSVLIIVSNHDEINATGQPTGYYLSEVAHPWHVFTEAGYEVSFGSPEGGFAPMDPKSFDLEDPVNREFWHTLEAVQGVMNTHALADVDPKAFDAIFFAGGHRTMYDFPGLRR